MPNGHHARAINKRALSLPLRYKRSGNKPALDSYSRNAIVKYNSCTKASSRHESRSAQEHPKSWTLSADTQAPPQIQIIYQKELHMSKLLISALTLVLSASAIAAEAPAPSTPPASLNTETGVLGGVNTKTAVAVGVAVTAVVAAAASGGGGGGGSDGPRTGGTTGTTGTTR